MMKALSFSGLFQLIDRRAFGRLVEKWGTDKGIRSFNTWEMTCALITSHVLSFSSYRNIEAVLKIPRSTLGDALTKRPYGFFQDLCDEILLSIRAHTKNRKIKRSIRELLAIDSTECRVHGSLFANANWRPKNAGTGARLASLKLHAVWNIDGEWVEDFLIAPARRNDMPVARGFEIQPNKTYVFDRAYDAVDYWAKIILAKAHFVSRLKSSHLEGEQRKRILSDKDGVLFDSPYTPSKSSLRKLPAKLRSKTLFRHVVYRDPETKKVFDFVTSDFSLAAKSVADIYKRRWAVELLFRWLKGHLGVRYLPAKTKNSCKTQLAAAILTKLLLRFKQVKNEFKGTPAELLRILASDVFHQGLIRSGPPAGCRWNKAIEAVLTHGSS
jgi:putative transposase